MISILYIQTEKSFPQESYSKLHRAQANMFIP